MNSSKSSSDSYYQDSELQMDSNLILCIEEKHNDNVDSRIFIGWSTSDNDFYVRGKRVGKKNNDKYVPYAFHCEKVSDLCNFLLFVIGRECNASITLYNYNNIDNVSDDDLTYEFFEELMDKYYEIAGYDNAQLSKKMLVSYLNMLKKTYNWSKC